MFTGKTYAFRKHTRLDSKKMSIMKFFLLRMTSMLGFLFVIFTVNLIIMLQYKYNLRAVSYQNEYYQHTSDTNYQNSIKQLSLNSTQLLSNPNPHQPVNSAITLMCKQVPTELIHNNANISNRFFRLPILAIFTTWPDDVDAIVRNNTCYNWASLKPSVHLTLFTNSTKAAADCKRNGWEIRPLIHTEAGGAPVLKLMFLDVMRRVDASLYGYANGDVLFGDDLLQTLVSVLMTLKNKEHPLLLIGVRTNVNNVTFLEASSLRKLRQASKTRGKLFMSMSQDYFITNRAFSWTEIPAVVVGRPAYDNWLVLNSIHKNHTVIDVTETVLAAHQTTKKNNFQGLSRPDPYYNAQLLFRYYKTIQFGAGSTICAPIRTSYSIDGKVFMVKRKGFPPFCGNPYG